jgi:hypothetical protein
MFPESARNFFLSLSFALAAWTTPATWRVLFAAAGCNIRSGANQGTYEPHLEAAAGE